MAQSHVNTLMITNADGRSADAQLTHEETYELAQFVKRLTWTDIRGCAASDDEAFEMRSAIGKVQDALARAGYAPR